MGVQLNVPRGWDSHQVGLTAAAGTAARILVDVSPARLAATIAGETALPGETGVRQRVFEGGRRVIDGSIASSDATSRSLLVWFGRLVRAAGAGLSTVSGTNTINAASGSFVTDGVVVGDAVMLVDTGTANHGVIATVTAVTATAITVSGTPFTNETLAATARLFKVALRTRRAVPGNAGNADSTPAVILIGGTQDPASAALPDTGWQLGPTGIVAVSLASSVSALPARIDVVAATADY